MDASLHIYSSFQSLTSFKVEFARRVGNGVLEEKKEGEKKKKQRENVIRLKQLFSFFSILVVLKVLCNLEFMLHLTLRFERNSFTALVYSGLPHPFALQPAYEKHNRRIAVLTSHVRNGRPRGKVYGSSGTRTCNSTFSPELFVFTTTCVIFSYSD